MITTVVIGLLVGLALGLTGGGGSIFAIPLLVFILGMAPQEAITLSLAAVALVSLSGVIPAARAGLVEYRVGAIFAAGGLLLAPAGVAAANRIGEQALLVSFAVLMAIVAVAMWWRAGSSPDDTRVVRASVASSDSDSAGPPCRFYPEDSVLRLNAPCSAVLTGAGIVTGFLSGLFGVGGGFIIVPALTTVTQLSIQRAVATSLLVITVIGASGLAAALLSGRTLSPTVTLAFLAGGLGGMYIGRATASAISGPSLQKTFSVLMVLVAIVTVWASSQGV